MLLRVLIFISSLWAIDFKFNMSTEIIVEVNGQVLTNPFSGGLNQPKVQWIDWDVDGDSDLFIMDADGFLRYYRNDSENNEFTFVLITTQFHGISSGGWFYFGDFNNDSLFDVAAQDIEILNNARYYQFDGESFDMDVINQTVQLGDTEISEIFNMSMVAHPFHIHDVQFYILDRNGIIPPENEQGRKDVVLIKQMETVRFIAKFEDHADDEVPYMYHCHMLQHEDEGLMGQFIVEGESVGNDENKTVLNDFTLFPAYPNPFNPTTQIRYDLPEDANVNITIYDIMGRSTKSLVNSNQTAGYRSVRWDATNNLGEPVSAGIYIYMIQAGEFRQTKKMVLLK